MVVSASDYIRFKGSLCVLCMGRRPLFLMRPLATPSSIPLTLLPLPPLVLAVLLSSSHLMIKDLHNFSITTSVQDGRSTARRPAKPTGRRTDHHSCLLASFYGQSCRCAYLLAIFQGLVRGEEEVMDLYPADEGCWPFGCSIHALGEVLRVWVGIPPCLYRFAIDSYPLLVSPRVCMHVASFETASSTGSVLPTRVPAERFILAG